MSFWISWPYLLAALAFGYALGSIPFGLVLTRLAGTADIRGIGSGNIGATNVLRTGRKDLAAATLALDALKGTAAVLLAGLQGPYLALAAGLGAFLGHLFPAWLGFRGGKGVATYLGVLLGLALLPLVHAWAGLAAFALAWLGVAGATRYSSAAALAGSVAAPLALWASGFAVESWAVAAMSVAVVLKHAPNIRRLMAGTESRIGSRA